MIFNSLLFPGNDRSVLRYILPEFHIAERNFGEGKGNVSVDSTKHCATALSIKVRPTRQRPSRREQSLGASPQSLLSPIGCIKIGCEIEC